jgi:D-lactate dehydrogenase (cytochrome)
VHINRDPDVLAAFLEDAAHFPGGHADGITAPTSEAEVVNAIRAARAVLPIGAQSSLTGGATPMGEMLLSTARLSRIIAIGDDWVRAEAGVTLVDLDRALARAGKSYPPTPTFTGAFVGGIAATNAAGAATFKYGTTREWVRAITVVLPEGDVLEIERGQLRAHAGELDIPLRGRTVRVPIPRYRMPSVAKTSAGYYAAPDMDAVDLFIGSEGTLGVITSVTLRTLPVRPARCVAFVPFGDRGVALAFVRRLREESAATWRSRDPHGLDVCAIEQMDGRSIALLREDGVDHLQHIAIPPKAQVALLVTLELPSETTPEQAYDEIGRAREGADSESGLIRFCRALDEAGVLDEVEIAVPGDEARAAQLLAAREAVPAAVNARVGRAKQTIDRRIAKTAADMIVPFDKLNDLLDLYDDEFRRRRLDAAVWGHISDGNLHPNVIPRSMADVASGEEAILTFGRAAIRLGGSPLAEHGVGRNPIKQRLLEELYGREGVEDMRRVKRAIDPEWKMAPGVLFRQP